MPSCDRYLYNLLWTVCCAPVVARPAVYAAAHGTRSDEERRVAERPSAGCASCHTQLVATQEQERKKLSRSCTTTLDRCLPVFVWKLAASIACGRPAMRPLARGGR